MPTGPLSDVFRLIIARNAAPTLTTRVVVDRLRVDRSIASIHRYRTDVRKLSFVPGRNAALRAHGMVLRGSTP